MARQADGKLAALANRFTAWRKGRTPGQRIPEPLWRAATRLVPEFGLCRTAQTLRLDYYKLKQRCEEAKPAAEPRFVELPGPAPHQECLIELEDASGAKMRIHLKGQTPDLKTLASMFWGGG